MRVHTEWAAILKAISDETRLLIVQELLKNELSVSRIADTLKMKMYNISKHMKVLEMSGIVSQRKQGNSKFYKISDDISIYKSGDAHVLDLGCCRFHFS